MRSRKLSTRWPSLALSTSTVRALLKSFILFIICALLPLRDGCLYMRRCEFSPPDKTSYPVPGSAAARGLGRICERTNPDRKSTRLNSSHSQISYAVFCLKKKKNKLRHGRCRDIQHHVTLRAVKSGP